MQYEAFMVKNTVYGPLFIILTFNLYVEENNYSYKCRHFKWDFILLIIFTYFFKNKSEYLSDICLSSYLQLVAAANYRNNKPNLTAVYIL